MKGVVKKAAEAAEAAKNNRVLSIPTMKRPMLMHTQPALPDHPEEMTLSGNIKLRGESLGEVKKGTSTGEAGCYKMLEASGDKNKAREIAQKTLSNIGINAPVTSVTSTGFDSNKGTCGVKLTLKIVPIIKHKIAPK